MSLSLITLKKLPKVYIILICSFVRIQLVSRLGIVIHIYKALSNGNFLLAEPSLFKRELKQSRILKSNFVNIKSIQQSGHNSFYITANSLVLPIQISNLIVFNFTLCPRIKMRSFLIGEKYCSIL